MVNYVVGYMFRGDLKNVVLILKNRPEYLAGQLNGVGGKIEDGEFPKEAMVREFEEEAGVKTTQEQWTQFADIVLPDGGVICCFRASDDAAYFSAHTTTDEEIVKVAARDLFSGKFAPTRNTQWLVPMALADDVYYTVTGRAKC